jgi:hypothetical protein
MVPRAAKLRKVASTANIAVAVVLVAAKLMVWVATGSVALLTSAADVRVGCLDPGLGLGEGAGREAGRQYSGMVVHPAGAFASFEALNAWLPTRCRELAQHTHPVTPEHSIAACFVTEQLAFASLTRWIW